MQSEEHSNGQNGLDPLSASSGNARSFGGGVQEGVENQHPLPELNVGLSMTQELQFPSPLIKLGSNDTSTNLAFGRKPRRHPLRPHRSKPLTQADRPYLTHPKYLEYRSRPRQDIGPDGKPIWPDRIEAAFQNALVHIKPMGRKKCSQRGRPYGRNMLIAEWIYRETGEVRVRKQVSSHIQVLDRFLKGIPEWDCLIKPGDDEDTSPIEGRKFYHNSIEHMVNEQKAIKSEIHQQGEFQADDPVDGDTPMQAVSSDIIHLQRLTFEMWVSQPDDWEHALHHYTRLQPFKLEPLALEDVPGWQAAFPHLPPIIETWTNGNQCELILLNASFQLMEDFPPRHSKLGIGLELDFLDQHWSATSHLDDLKDWTCVTHMYRDGLEISAPTHEECRASGPGKIKPFFQSRWWATSFTSLTEAKRLAEESKDLGAIELAHQLSSNFLGGLTIMQELSALDTRPGRYGEKYTRRSRRRTAVLLWRFSQAPLGSGGTTTWQSIWVPPLNNLATTSTVPSAEMGLPPLSVHSVDDYSPNAVSFDSSSQFLSQNSLPYHMYLGPMDEELCQDGFMAFKPGPVADSGHLGSSYSFPSTQGFLPSCELGSLTSNLDIAHSNLHAVSGNGDDSMESANVFELPELEGHMNAQSDTSSMKEPRHPLTRFNIQTHQVLQEQLGSEDHSVTQPLPDIEPDSNLPPSGTTDEHSWNEFHRENGYSNLSAESPPTKLPVPSWVSIDEQDQALHSALLAACAMSDLRVPPQGTPPGHRGHGNCKLELPDEPQCGSPSMFRPTLHSHHSFPGIRSMQGTNGESCGLPFDEHDGAHGLALLQSQLRQNGECQVFASMVPDELHRVGGSYSGGTRGLPRAQSEPDPGPMRLAVPTPAVGSGLMEINQRHHETEEMEEILRSRHQGESPAALD
ncbi:hypothetical protein A1O3_03155 [Capronia epimyces CBS 606.96]|uniref:TEA domain-containing protein n=1 Tax=Capronia epimyces CBS 606.96 TaxID=1182542 RepID=W9YLF9_9EURO|nr:uncharacterized protein A1O3_03155 [Capronia epimyces CBS 606.96]EXJ90086.1 hypothetical protein A1O3_03155 [Capronia epimyces CBS 606.96]